MIFLNENLLEKLQIVEGPRYTKILWVDDHIYGIGGWNRYYVNHMLSNGEKKYNEFEPTEVVFSAFHSDDKRIKKAEAAGFRIFY